MGCTLPLCIHLLLKITVISSNHVCTWWDCFKWRGVAHWDQRPPCKNANTLALFTWKTSCVDLLCLLQERISQFHSWLACAESILDNCDMMIEFYHPPDRENDQDSWFWTITVAMGAILDKLIFNWQANTLLQWLLQRAPRFSLRHTASPMRRLVFRSGLLWFMHVWLYCLVHGGKPKQLTGCFFKNTRGMKRNPSRGVFLLEALHRFDHSLRVPLRFLFCHLHGDLRASVSCSSARYSLAAAATLDSNLPEYFGTESTVTPLAGVGKVLERAQSGVIKGRFQT